MKKTKAAKIAKMLSNGNSVAVIKRMLGVSESYIYAIKKQMEGAMEEAEEVIKETLHNITQGRQQYREAAEADTNVDAILNERAGNYGPFATQAMIAQRLKHVAHTAAGEQGKTFATDQAEALDMIFSKIARILNGDPNHLDSWTDIAGYATLVADRLQGKIR